MPTMWRTNANLAQKEDQVLFAAMLLFMAHCESQDKLLRNLREKFFSVGPNLQSRMRRHFQEKENTETLPRLRQRI
ncbi:MAG TPA: hypothetical protein VND65_19260 [Candidatus Binatia bacterium]|nr:hypothetical protein [Candidatus Binatia bacterium]